MDMVGTGTEWDYHSVLDEIHIAFLLPTDYYSYLDYTRDEQEVRKLKRIANLPIF